MGVKHKDLTQFLSVPALCLYLVFFVYPLVQGFAMSFTNWDGMGNASFVGIDNYVRFFSDGRAMNDIRTTVVFALASATLLNLVGLAYALLMDRDFRLRGLVRVISSLPAIISPLIMGYIWYFLLQPPIPRACPCWWQSMSGSSRE